jgi:hypothetical protein
MPVLPRTVSLCLLVATLALARPASGQVAPATFSADLGGRAKLAFSSSILSFPGADPDTVLQVSAVSGPITVTTKARASLGGTVVLTVLATDDLRSGVNVIPVNALTWTATGDGFVGGTVSRTAPQTVGSWNGSGVRTGTQQFLFRNLWTYSTGTYTVTLQYTLSAP